MLCKAVWIEETMSILWFLLIVLFLTVRIPTTLPFTSTWANVLFFSFAFGLYVGAYRYLNDKWPWQKTQNVNNGYRES